MREPVADIGPQQTRRLERVIDHLGGVRNDAMGVHIDGLDPLAGDHDLPAVLRVRRRPGAAAAARSGAGPGADAGGEPAVGKDDVSPRVGSRTGQMVPAFRHIDPPHPKHRPPSGRRPEPTPERLRNPTLRR